MDTNAVRPGTSALKSAVVAMLVITTISLTLRIWSRLVCSTKDKLWWDDWLAIPAWACNFCLCTMMLTAAGPTFGRHSDAYSPADLLRAFRFLYVGEIVFHVCLSLVKFSALLFCKRLFTTRSRRFRVCYWTSVAGVVAFALLAVISSIAACAAPDDASNVDARSLCFDTYVHYGLSVAVPVVDIVTDLMILVLPMPVISDLHVPSSRRAALYSVFILGYLTWIASIGRLIATIQLKPTDLDPAWDLLPILGWATGEASLGITTICIPPCYGLYRRLVRGGVSALFHARDLPARAPTYVVRPVPHSAESHSSLLSLRDRGPSSSGRLSATSLGSEGVWERDGKEGGLGVGASVSLRSVER